MTSEVQTELFGSLARSSSENTILVIGSFIDKPISVQCCFTLPVLFSIFPSWTRHNVKSRWTSFRHGSRAVLFSRKISVTHILEVSIEGQFFFNRRGGDVVTFLILLLRCSLTKWKLIRCSFSGRRIIYSNLRSFLSFSMNSFLSIFWSTSVQPRYYSVCFKYFDKGLELIVSRLSLNTISISFTLSSMTNFSSSLRARIFLGYLNFWNIFMSLNLF